MNRIRAKYYPHIEIKLYFKCTKKLSNLLRVKDHPICIKNILELVVVPAILGKLPAIST